MAKAKKAEKKEYVKHHLSQKKKEDEKAAAKEKAEEAKKEEKPVTKEEPKKAPKKEEKEEKKFIKESIHMIPLRKAFDYPRTKRMKYALREIKRYVAKHTRKEALIDPSVNELLWKKSIQNPPRRVKVKIQEEEERAIVTLP